MPDLSKPEFFAIEYAALAREVAMDIFPLEQILAVHRVTDLEWEKISTHPKFLEMVADMVRTWNAAATTPDRVRTKAQTGLEARIEHFVNAISDETIPLGQRVEAGKFLARLGELDGNQQILGAGSAGGAGISIVLNIGNVTKRMDGEELRVIEHRDTP
jgi:hypothetical protein